MRVAHGLLSCIQQHQPSRSQLVMFGLLAVSWSFPASAKQTLHQIADTFAGSAIEEGEVVGVGVGILIGNAPPRFFSYGAADVGNGRRFSPDRIFEIGSVTKIFTTNLLGQTAYGGLVKLNDPLSDFSAQLGTLPPLTSQVTLEELADFTAGFPSLAPLCASSSVPGCLPSDRPTVQEYGAAHFLAYFQNTVPANQNVSPPQPVAALPAPYFYSDFSIGLLGLLLGAKPDAPINNSALDGWFAAMQQSLLIPLGMQSTYLEIPPGVSGRMARGYNLALARATVAGGQIASVTVTASGGSYSTPPEVRIVGGGGSGATAVATLDAAGGVREIKVQNGGSDYIAPATVTFSSTSATEPATASVVVSKGRITGVKVVSGGAGYTTAPQVTISGGRSDTGQDATATAHIANGQISFVTVDDGGDGYLPPLAVVVAPGDPLHNSIPIWAAAGALSSTVRDMMQLAAAALGHSEIAGYPVDPAITEGFRIAETPYTCMKGPPDLSSCPASTPRSGLAWSIEPDDPANGLPGTVSKNGGLPGFSTELILMPDRDMAVVVFTNTRENSTDMGEEPTRPAAVIARNILLALVYNEVD